MKKALVFGGSGQLGAAVAEHLLESGWRVVAVTHGGRPPPQPVLDRGAAAVDGSDRTLEQILSEVGQGVDAVFDPTAYTPDHAPAWVKSRGRFGSLVVVSSSSVYADAQGRSLDEARQTGFPVFDAPMTEETSTVEPGPQTYSTQKVAMETVLRSSGMPATILRPCAVYGKHVLHPREWWFVKRALDRRPHIPVAYGAESLFHTSSARGIATLAEICMASPQARTLNVADPTPLSVRQIAAVIEDAIGMPLPLVPYKGGPSAPSYVGSTPWSAERPFLLDTSRARGLGWDGGGEYRDRVREVCRWLIDTASRDDWKAHFTRFAKYGYDPFDYGAEDAFLAALPQGGGNPR